MAADNTIEVVFRTPDAGAAGANAGAAGANPAAPAAAQADWPARFRELQNRADAQQAMTDAERRELADLQRRLMTEAESLRRLITAPPAPQPAAPAPPAVPSRPAAAEPQPAAPVVPPPPPAAPASPTPPATPAPAAADPHAKTQPVALTRENVELVTAALAGKIGPAEFARRMAGGTGPQPARPAAEDDGGRDDQIATSPFATLASLGTRRPDDDAPRAPAGAPQPTGHRAAAARPGVSQRPDDARADVEKQRQAERDRDRERHENRQVRAVADRYQKPTARGQALRNEVTDDAARAEREQAARLAQARDVSEGAQTASMSRGVGGKAAGLAQVAATGVLGAEAAALATGPVGAAVVAGGIIYDQVSELIKKPFEQARAAIDGFAQAGKNVANNDLGALAEQGSEAFAGFVEKAGLAGVVLAEQVRTYTAAVRAAQAVVDSFVQRGRQLAAFDGRLASAGAQADVARLQADIREARVTGDQVAKLTRAQSQIEQTNREAMLFIKTEVIGAINAIVEPVAEVAEAVRPVLQLMNDGKRDVSIIATFIRALPVYWIVKLIGWSAKVFEWAAKKLPGAREERTLLDEVFEAANELLQPPKNDAKQTARPPAAQKAANPVAMGFPEVRRKP